jgi:hypothetical protein
VAVTVDPGFWALQELAMEDLEEDCIWLRADAWLTAGDGQPVKVQTRKFCRAGVFLEVSWPVPENRVEVVFPDPTARGGGRRIGGTVTRRAHDGIWVQFNNQLRSSSEILMRSGLSQRTRPLHSPPAAVSFSR